MNLVTFTSDFGLRDNYAGVVKGVMLGINPDLRIIDLSHDITPFSIGEAAYLIKTAYQYFPHGTVHLAVIDPGVGTDRLPLILHTPAYDFVGPDNGVFTEIIRYEPVKIFAILHDRLRKHAQLQTSPSQTFDGRDLFGPAAALLAKGIRITEIAEPAGKEPVLLTEPPSYRKGRQKLDVRYVDRFGNLITALHRGQLQQDNRIFRIKAGDFSIKKISHNFQEEPSGRLLAIWGSAGYLEISMNQGSAADMLRYRPGADLLEIEIR